jgi:hypothetical protein
MPGVTVPGPARPSRSGGTLRAGWRVVATSPDRVLVATLALSLPAIAVHVLLQHLISTEVAGTSACVRDYLGTVLYADCLPPDARGQLAVLVGLFVLFVLAHLVVAGIDRAVLDVLDDVPVRGPYAGWRWRTVVPAALLLGAMLTVATLFLVLPGIVLAFLTRYALLFVVDGGMNPLAAVVASVQLVARRLGSELGFAVRSLLLMLLGALACGIGLYLAVPVVLAAQAIRYRESVPVVSTGSTRGG